jgi:DNA invertase Pin-like site-specific DNA recombinase
MRMIQDALDGKLDIILTKSISRFARNTLDTLKYVRMLKEKKIAIIFEEENINTLEMAGELLLTILSSVAQQESETISSHVTLGIEMKMKRGEMVGYNKALGYDYDKENKILTVNNDEAQWVHYIFDRYCKGIGAKTIARELTKLKLTTPRGNEKWSDSTVLGIIKNEMYKGDLLMGKTYTADPITHRRVVNYGERNQYYVKEHHEAIISEETWNKAQAILSKRSAVRNCGRRKGNYSRKYAFSSRIFCGYCGSVFTRRCWASGSKNEKRVWQCMSSVKDGIKNCTKCKGIREEVLEQCFVDAYELLCRNNNEVIDKFMQKIKSTAKDTSNDLSIKKLQKKLEELEKKMSVLVDLHIEGNIDEKVYLNKKTEIDEKREKLQHDLELLKLDKNDEKNLEIGLGKIENILKSNQIMPEFDADVFEALIKKVIIGEDDDPMAVCFVLKDGDELKDIASERHEKIMENEEYSNQDIVLNFYSHQRVVNFEKSGIGKIKKIIDKIRVKVVYYQKN